MYVDLFLPFCEWQIRTPAIVCGPEHSGIPHEKEHICYFAPARQAKKVFSESKRCAGQDKSLETCRKRPRAVRPMLQCL